MPAKPSRTEDPARALLREAQRALQAGNAHQAAAAARRLAKLKPNDPTALSACGWIAHQAGDRRAAARFLEESLALDPNQVEALSNLASLYQAEGRYDAAVDLLDRALARDASIASLHYNRGNALKALGRLEAAETAFRAAIEREPATAAFHGNLANTLVALDRLEDAIEAYRRSLVLRHDHVETLRNLGLALTKLRRFDEADAALRAAVALDPQSADNHAAIAALRADRVDLTGAGAAYRHALALKPNDSDLHNRLGLLYLRDSRLTSDAIACFEASIACAPETSAAYTNLGGARLRQGGVAEGIAHCERGVVANPHDPAAGSSLLLALHYDPDLAPAALTRRHIEWAERHVDRHRPDAAAVYPNVPEPGRRLRVGYVSPDFRMHAVGDFMQPLLAHHDRAQIEVACYAEVVHPDERTEAFRALADRWRLIVGRGDEHVAAQIRDDGIDILVDLTGHSADHRLGVFARKPAPIQATWLGYPGTTGMAAIDYRLTDAIADPAPADDALHRERLIRLPHGFLCYQPRQDTPAVAPSPGVAHGAVTFGSFNNLAKINPRVMATWARLLDAVPGSRLLVKYHHLADEATREGIAERLVAAGIARARISLEPGIRDWTRHMAMYSEVDVALDPFPYNGTTTTCEALWMGVPVVTLAGDRHAARVGASLLSRVGIGELIARDVDDYVAKAAALARDPQRLTALRASLRERCAATLGDAAGFARDVEAAYRAIWTAWCERRRAVP